MPGERLEDFGPWTKNIQAWLPTWACYVTENNMSSFSQGVANLISEFSVNLCDFGYVDVVPGVKDYRNTLTLCPSESYICAEVSVNYAAVASGKLIAPEIVVKISFQSADRIPLLSISRCRNYITRYWVGFFDKAHAVDHTVLVGLERFL